MHAACDSVASRQTRPRRGNDRRRGEVGSAIHGNEHPLAGFTCPWQGRSQYRTPRKTIRNDRIPKGESIEPDRLKVRVNRRRESAGNHRERRESILPLRNDTLHRAAAARWKRVRLRAETHRQQEQKQNWQELFHLEHFQGIERQRQFGIHEAQRIHATSARSRAR